MRPGRTKYLDRVLIPRDLEGRGSLKWLKALSLDRKVLIEFNLIPTCTITWATGTTQHVAPGDGTGASGTLERDRLSSLFHHQINDLSRVSDIGWDCDQKLT